MALVRIHSPDSGPELMVLVAMLEAHDVPCYVHNSGFGSLWPGAQVNAYNTQSIMVPEEKVAEAISLLADYRSQPGEIDEETKPAGKLAAEPLHTLRAMVEVLMFGWFVPGGLASKQRRNKLGDE